MSSYLLPIADQAALSWIVRQQRTAFAGHRRRDAEMLRRGDRLLLYSTRGCFHNPTRDRGRVIGVAIVASEARMSKTAVTFDGRTYPMVVRLRIEALAPPRAGVELAPLVPQLGETFPDPATWSARLRRALVLLADADAETIVTFVPDCVLPYRDVRKAYAT